MAAIVTLLMEDQRRKGDKKVSKEEEWEGIPASLPVVL